MTEYKVLTLIAIGFVMAGVLSYLFTPLVKKLAYKIGAIDVPKDSRRMHKKPIPRLGGLAIFLGFIISILFVGDLSRSMQSILMGASIIVILGIFDDVMALSAKLKFLVQIIAA